jgi:hypothetical protein
VITCVCSDCFDHARHPPRPGGVKRITRLFLHPIGKKYPVGQGTCWGCYSDQLQMLVRHTVRGPTVYTVTDFTTVVTAEYCHTVTSYLGHLPQVEPLPRAYYTTVMAEWLAQFRRNRKEQRQTPSKEKGFCPHTTWSHVKDCHIGSSSSEKQLLAWGQIFDHVPGHDV